MSATPTPEPTDGDKYWDAVYEALFTGTTTLELDDGSSVTVDWTKGERPE